VSEIRRLAKEMAEATAEWRRAKRMYRAVSDAYRQAFRDEATADVKASGDHRLQQAISDCRHYREEAMASALALLAHIAFEDWSHSDFVPSMVFPVSPPAAETQTPAAGAAGGDR
jgi:hypothetical protein